MIGKKVFLILILGIVFFTVPLVSANWTCTLPGDYGVQTNPASCGIVGINQPLEMYYSGSLNPHCIGYHYMDNLAVLKFDDTGNHTSITSTYTWFDFHNSMQTVKNIPGATHIRIVRAMGACPAQGTKITGGTYENNVGWWVSGTFQPPDADFFGYPLDGYSPLLVNFTVTNSSAANETGFSWTWGDGQTTTSNQSSLSHTYQNPGIYTVTLNYYNLTGNPQTVTKTNYILASTPSGLIVNLDVRDATGSYPLIQESTVGIKNMTTGVWRNNTLSGGKAYYSTTDPGYLYSLTQNQSITLAANATGYREASTTFNIPYNNYLVKLFLMPNTVVNSTGNATLVVNTVRNIDRMSMPYVSIVLDTGQMGITNGAGAVTFYNVSAGDRTATATDGNAVYETTKTSFNLIAGETRLLVIQMIKTGETPVETPVSPTPTPIGTYDPDDPNSPVYGNKSTNQINIEGGAGILALLSLLYDIGPLVVLGILYKFGKSVLT